MNQIKKSKARESTLKMTLSDEVEDAVQESLQQLGVPLVFVMW